MKFTRIILASLLVLFCSVGAKADTDIFTAGYQPNGDSFLNENVNIDFSKESIVAQIDLSGCTERNENILSIGTNAGAWDTSKGVYNIHMYYNPSSTTVSGSTITARTLKLHIFVDGDKKDIDVANLTSPANSAAGVEANNKVTIELNNKGLYINGAKIVSAESDTLKTLLTKTTIQVGSKEGSARSKATYTSVKVVTNSSVNLKSRYAGTIPYDVSCYIIPATNTSKALYVERAYEDTPKTYIKVGDLSTHYTGFAWTFKKSSYTTSGFYNYNINNDYANYALDINSGEASAAPQLWRTEDVYGKSDSNGNVNQRYYPQDTGDGAFTLSTSKTSGTTTETYFLKWDETSGTLSKTQVAEDATKFYIVNTTPTQEVTLDETSTTNTSVIAGLDKTAKYTFNIKRTFKGDKWCSIVLPFDVPYTEITDVFGDGVVVARFSGHNETTLGFETITDKIEAGTPYIIKVPQASVDSYDSETGWTFTDIESWTYEVTDVQKGGYNTTTMAVLPNVNFHGTFNKTTVSVTATGYAKYVLSDGKIWRLTAQSNEEKGFRAIFEDQSEYGAPSQISAWTLDGNTTAIESIDGVAAPMQPQNVYNLSGQLVEAGATSTDNLPKGVYIVGGRKVVKN